jgi:hypothetical protein
MRSLRNTRVRRNSSGEALGNISNVQTIQVLLMFVIWFRFACGRGVIKIYYYTRGQRPTVKIVTASLTFNDFPVGYLDAFSFLFEFRGTHKSITSFLYFQYCYYIDTASNVKTPIWKH